MEIIKTKNLVKVYGDGASSVKALDGVSVSIQEGSFNAIVGTSGSGKTTLLQMLGGLDQPTEGEVTIDGNLITNFDEEKLTIYRRKKIGFVFQEFNLLPILNIYENIVLPLQLDGREVDTEYLNQILEVLTIKDKLDMFPNNLSGGQQQRVAIARALITKPAIILADEPTGNLDKITSKEVIRLLKKTKEVFHQTIIIITHDNDIAFNADRVIRIEDGKMI